MDFPPISILLPVLDEIDWIDACLASVAAQDHPGSWEVVVADGGSTDGTLDRLAEWSQRLPLVVVANPGRRQSAGLDRAAERASGELFVRMDAHTTYEPDYLRRSVETLLETGADAVGGPLIPAGTTPFGRAVARMMQSRLGIGPAPFHHGAKRGEVDTVYLGTFAAETFRELGGMRTFPSGVAEEADFYWRLRRRGGRVVLDPEIRSRYVPRQTPGALARQFWRYGLGKADLLYVNGRWPSWRPAAPLGLILGLAAGLVAGPLWSWWPLVGVAGAWGAALLIAARGRPLDVAAAGIMHLSYGLGLLRGLLRWPPRVRRAVG